MAVERNVFVIGFILTVCIFVSLFFVNTFFNSVRTDAVSNQISTIENEYQEIQTLMLLSQYYEGNTSCLALSTALERMNENLWDLGLRIDQYQQATEEFSKDPFYLEQKKVFNQYQVLYFSTLQRMNEMCDTNQVILTYFYKKKEECPTCDIQSFVLTDIKKDLEKIEKSNEIAIFSFDYDFNISTINFLAESYNITEYPCVVINEQPVCGVQDKVQLIAKICSQANMSLC